MRKIKSLLIFLIIAAILAAILSACSSTEKEPYIPEGAIVVRGVIILPESFDVLEQMGEMFVEAYPLENLDPFYHENPDRLEYLLEDMARHAGLRLYISGVRGLESIEYVDEPLVGGMIAKDLQGETYYLLVHHGNIELITKSGWQGEILLDDRRVCGLGWAMERQHRQEQMMWFVVSIICLVVFAAAGVAAVFVLVRRNKKEELAEKAR